VDAGAPVAAPVPVPGTVRFTVADALEVLTVGVPFDVAYRTRVSRDDGLDRVTVNVNVVVPELPSACWMSLIENVGVAAPRPTS
jgi:hypothetical protein